MTVAGFEALEDVVRERFKTLVADVQGVPVQYDNDPHFEPPDSGTWMRMQVHFDRSFPVETGGVGSQRTRIPGMLAISCFVTLGIGTEAALQLVDAIANALRNKQFSGVKFRTPTVSKIGWVEPIKDRYQVDVDTPFYSDVIA
jgi:hypothetical protein